MSATYNITFTPASGSNTLVEYRKEAEISWTTPSSPSNPTSLTYYPLTLENGTVYYVRVSSISVEGKCSKKSRIIRIDTGVETGTTTSTSTTTSTTTSVSPGSPVAYWGWKSDNTTLSPSSITSSSHHSSFTTGGTISADYTANSNAQFLWMAEPSSEPAKTKWAIGGIEGSIGGPSDAFAAPVISGGFRFYITSYLTASTVYPINFLVS